MNSDEDQLKAAAAVLVRSTSMPAGSLEVKGADFDAMRQKTKTDGAITVNDLLSSMRTTGFQATSLGKAVDVIDSMVGPSRGL